MEYAVTGVLVVLILLLLISMNLFRKKDYQGLALFMAKKERKNFEVLRPCPVCGAMLKKGQTLKTKVIEIKNSASAGTGNRLGVKENLAHVFGCPYCWPNNPEHPRLCPVCRKTQGDADFLVARYFERNEGRNHLRILGCTLCKPTKM